jgi:hypothetical protein
LIETHYSRIADSVLGFIEQAIRTLSSERIAPLLGAGWDRDCYQTEAGRICKRDYFPYSGAASDAREF